MSFVNKIKGWGQKGGADQTALDGDVAVVDDYRPRRGSARAAATGRALLQCQRTGGAGGREGGLGCV